MIFCVTPVQLIWDLHFRGLPVLQRKLSHACKTSELHTPSLGLHIFTGFSKCSIIPLWLISFHITADPVPYSWTHWGWNQLMWSSASPWMPTRYWWSIRRTQRVVECWEGYRMDQLCSHLQQMNGRMVWRGWEGARREREREGEREREREIWDWERFL